MKTTLDLPEDLLREAKIRAAREGKKLKEVMEQALRHGLGISGETVQPAVHFPDFKMLRKSIGTDRVNGPNEVISQREIAS